MVAVNKYKLVWDFAVATMWVSSMKKIVFGTLSKLCNVLLIFLKAAMIFIVSKSFEILEYLQHALNKRNTTMSTYYTWKISKLAQIISIYFHTFVVLQRTSKLNRTGWNFYFIGYNIIVKITWLTSLFYFLQ